ncbi:MAG TPA: class I SAM-dependent methyltransferase, partial [Anaeromyxobacteraceae bacterium]|nr:class I SAM-dependent methyltransferase [Anaeromyxobacteraceae bacterium]
AAGYDGFMATTERASLGRIRRELMTGAAGRVLEIGGGTGANLPFYGAGVSQLIITEPEEPMARRLERKLRGYQLPIQVLRARAERLPLESESIDCAVSTLVLCTVAAPAQALAEVRRVLKRQGRLLLVEHVRSEDPALARWQDRLRGVWGLFGHGCQCNRATIQNLRNAGFSVGDLRREDLSKAPAIVRPVVIGAAVRDG